MEQVKETMNRKIKDAVCEEKKLQQVFKGSPTEKVAGSIRALPKWGGGVSTLARMVWGTYLEKKCPS